MNGPKAVLGLDTLDDVGGSSTGTLPDGIATKYDGQTETPLGGLETFLLHIGKVLIIYKK